VVTGAAGVRVTPRSTTAGVGTGAGVETTGFCVTGPSGKTTGAGEIAGATGVGTASLRCDRPIAVTIPNVDVAAAPATTIRLIAAGCRRRRRAAGARPDVGL